MAISGMNNLLSWVNQLVAFYSRDEIKIPENYRDRILETKKLLEKDSSGLVSTILDFYISASLVDYTVETSNKNLTELLNNWLSDINSSWRGLLPTGIDDLAKEYFRERWKGSSVLLLRSQWEEKGNFRLPTRLWFADGEDVLIKNGIEKNEQVVSLDKIRYALRISSNKSINLPENDNEKIFVQKPFSAWSDLRPTPFLIQRGIYRNLQFLQLLERKGEKLVAKALEYILMLKKGTENLFLQGNVSYGREDLEKAKEDFKKFVDAKNTSQGVSSYFTNFDTEVDEYIPDYNKILNQQLYTPIERRLLFALGLVDIIIGASSTRRESILNPKPMIAEINNGIRDFKKLLFDIMKEIVDENSDAHPKYMGNIIRITNTPIKVFVDDKFRTMIRSWYDRGLISKRTALENSIDFNFNIEVDRRKQETKNGLDGVLYPPIIQNLEQNPADLTPFGDEDTPPDKKNIEKRNFLVSVECPNCANEMDIDYVASFDDLENMECDECGGEITKQYLIEQAKKQDDENEQEILKVLEESQVDITKNFIRIRQKEPRLFQKNSFRIIWISEDKGIKAIIGRIKGQKTTSVQSYLFVKEKWSTQEAQNWIKEHKGSVEEKILELAPYTTTNFPSQLKNLPRGARNLWIRTFNAIFRKTRSEDQARRGAWHAVKLKYKKSGNNWQRRTDAEFKEEAKNTDLQELIELKKLEILGKKDKILDELIRGVKSDENSE